MSLKRAEHVLESTIFNSRRLMAPFYVGLVVSLVVVLLKFIAILYDFILKAWTASESDIVVSVLSLIDVSLIGNLILIIVFASTRILFPALMRLATRTGPNGWPKSVSPEQSRSCWPQSSLFRRSRYLRHS